MKRLHRLMARDRVRAWSTGDSRLVFWLMVAGGVLLGTVLVDPTPSFGRHATGDPGAGRDIFLESCQHCHGPNGRGDGQMAEYLTPPPANLASARTQARTDDELRKVILEGREGTAMAGFFEALEDRQLIDLLAYIRTLKAEAR